MPFADGCGVSYWSYERHIRCDRGTESLQICTDMCLSPSALTYVSCLIAPALPPGWQVVMQNGCTFASPTPVPYNRWQSAHGMPAASSNIVGNAGSRRHACLGLRLHR